MKGVADTLTELLVALNSQSRRQDEALTDLDLAVSGLTSFGGVMMEEMHHEVTERSLGVVRDLEAGLKATRHEFEQQVGASNESH